jgi:peptidoglycan/LPS O-acetylase OafA/YrhL
VTEPAKHAISEPVQEQPRLEFKFADGLRALAAFAITLLHSYLAVGHTGQAGRDLPRVFKVFQLGDLAVPFFIVLSGFVLMLPVARRADLDFRTGHWEFFRRRARRILPPYYASIVLFIILIKLVPDLQTPMKTQWDSKIPVNLHNVISHLVLVQNIDPVSTFKINGPTWSIATEWQIYLLMPFLLLPLWRGLGMKMTVVVAIFIGWGIHIVWPQYDEGHLWFLGLFAMGMAAAYVAAWRIRIPYLGLITAAAVLAACFSMWKWFDLVHKYAFISETLLGAVIALLLAWMAERSRAGRRTVLHSILECRFLVWVGLWSYSMYLIHSPFVQWGNIMLLHRTMTTKDRFLIQIFVILPITLIICYVFHRLVERRFMNSHQRAVVAHTVTEDPVDVADTAPPGDAGRSGPRR